VHPDGGQLKLWAKAIEWLDLAQSRGERVRASLEKFYVEPGEVFTEPLALGAVYATLSAPRRAPRGFRSCSAYSPRSLSCARLSPRAATRRWPI
jgi:hypothetical protein